MMRGGKKSFVYHGHAKVEVFGDVSLFGVLVAIHAHDAVAETWNAARGNAAFRKAIAIVG
jgi:hypothetical protein